MKKVLLLFLLFGLCSCINDKKTDSTKSELSFSNSYSEITTESISISNYRRYIRAEKVSYNNAFSIKEEIVFSGALTFATYDVTVTYSGINWETGEQGTYILKLDIGGGGKTIMISGSATIENVVGTCTYRL